MEKYFENVSATKQGRIVVENQILSPVHVYSSFLKTQGIVIEMHDNYQKRTYRNRFIISGPGGRHVISIPLKKGKNSLRHSQVEISYDMPWVGSLAATIKSYYGSAPYFDHYFHDLLSIFKKEHTQLFVLNNELRDYVFKSLDIEIPFSYTNRYIADYGEGYQDMRDKFSPLKTLKTGLGVVPYNHVFMDKNGFITGLSIIDLIFNTGKYASQYLLSQPSK